MLAVEPECAGDMLRTLKQRFADAVCIGQVETHRDWALRATNIEVAARQSARFLQLRSEFETRPSLLFSPAPKGTESSRWTRSEFDE